MNKDAVSGDERSVTGKDGEGDGVDLEKWIPLSVREARRARRRREHLWPWVWMSFASVVVLAVALAILAYRLGAKSCH